MFNDSLANINLHAQGSGTASLTVHVTGQIWVAYYGNEEPFWRNFILNSCVFAILCAWY